MTNKYLWQGYNNEPTIYPSLKEAHRVIHLLLSQIGIKIGEENKFLFPNLENLNSSESLFDTKRAAKAIKKAIDSKKKLFIHGDYDVDGISATSILWDYLYRFHKADVTPLIPNRFTEGYGLSESTLDKVAENGGTFVVTVDCGIKDIEIIKKYKNLEFVITDHHTYPTDSNGEKLQLKSTNLHAIVHPQYPGKEYAYHEICGTTVAWKLIQTFEKLYPTKCNVNDYLPLVALATVTDIMPLKDENRIILTEGLNTLKKSNYFNLHFLLENADVKPSDLDSYHFGYVIGPRINAAGRLEDALDAVRFLVSKNASTAKSIVAKLTSLNQKRQQITIDMLEAIEKQIDKKAKFIFVVGEDWSEGVVGLAAGKICEKYNRPVIVGSLDKEKGIVKASARSIASYHITDALDRNSDLLEKFGGHAQAAGLTFKYSNFKELKNRMSADASSKISDEDLIPKLNYLTQIELEDIDKHLLDAINAFKPFGHGNPNPLFRLEGIEILDIKSIGKDRKHAKLVVAKQNTQFVAMAFGLYERFQNINRGDMIDVIAALKYNYWNGHSEIQLELKDFKKVA